MDIAVRVGPTLHWKTHRSLKHCGRTHPKLPTINTSILSTPGMISSLPAQSFLAHLGTSILDDGTFHCLRPLIHTQGNSPYSLRIHDVCTLLFCRGGVGGHRRLHGIKWRVNLETVKRAWRFHARPAKRTVNLLGEPKSKPQHKRLFGGLEYRHTSIASMSWHEQIDMMVRMEMQAWNKRIPRLRSPVTA